MEEAEYAVKCVLFVVKNALLHRMPQWKGHFSVPLLFYPITRISKAVV